MHSSLWAPWRLAYIRALESQADAAKASPPAGNPNFLAEYWSHPERDQAQHVVHRDARGMVLLNRYPYTNGHLLVALGEPQPTIDRYAPADRAHFWRLMELAMDLCEHAFAPQGMNVGINLGRAAGAGLPEHLHGHVVPRWNGDTNFMSVLGATRMIPDALERTFDAYRTVLPESLVRTGLVAG
jgi:ATP adenylyltransferase